MTSPYKVCPACQLSYASSLAECPRCAHFRRSQQPVPVVKKPSGWDWPASTPQQWFSGLAAIAAILFFCWVIIPWMFPRGGRNSNDDLYKVKFGMQVADVQQIMGEPDQSQDFQSTGMRMQMFYYTVGGRQVQIAFQNGRVDSINRY